MVGKGLQDAAIVSMLSGRLGGQTGVDCDCATFVIATSGPGVSGICFWLKICLPRLPATFSHKVIVPVPGLKTFTQSEKSPNLKSVQVWLIAGSSSCTIIASTWLATGIA